MGDDHPKPRNEADAALEREIRAERKFSLSEAIAQMAGPGIMKGASPIDRKRQAAAEIQEYLCRNLVDHAGSLSGVLLRQVTESDLLLKDLEHPLAVLACHVRHVLGSDCDLKELVREADVAWGRAQDERPIFEKEGRPPSPDDPYTLESVRATLGRLAGGLSAGQA